MFDVMGYIGFEVFRLPALPERRWDFGLVWELFGVLLARKWPGGKRDV
jgi:hypothetical protein